MKKMIFVTSPPACGKTYVSQQIAKELNNCVYLDKDALIPLSKQIFKAANEPVNRSSDFFEEYIRDYEYEAILEVGFQAIEFSDYVIINAPFSKEIRDEKYLDDIRKKLERYGAELFLIWVNCDTEVVRKRMIARDSERDWWKIQHWDEYIKTKDYSIPTGIKGLHVFENSSAEDFRKNLENIAKLIRE